MDRRDAYRAVIVYHAVRYLVLTKLKMQSTADLASAYYYLDGRYDLAVGNIELERVLVGEALLVSPYQLIEAGEQIRHTADMTYVRMRYKQGACFHYVKSRGVCAVNAIFACVKPIVVFADLDYKRGVVHIFHGLGA
jgi:hypothetical protein